MKTKGNLRLINYEEGDLLVKKCITDDDMLGVELLLVIEDDELFIEPKTTLAFSDEEKQENCFNSYDSKFKPIFDGLLNTVKEALNEN